MNAATYREAVRRARQAHLTSKDGGDGDPIPAGNQGMARSHKPSLAGSIPAPATTSAYREAFSSDFADLCDADPGDEQPATPRADVLRFRASEGDVIATSIDRANNRNVHLLTPAEAMEKAEQLYDAALQAEEQQQRAALVMADFMKGARHG